MRQKKLTAIVIAIIIAIATLIPTLAFAREKPPRPNNRPPMTDMQRKIHDHSMARVERKIRHDNRPYIAHHRAMQRNCYRGYYDYYRPYDLDYYHYPTFASWDKLDLDYLARVALDAAYVSYLSKQADNVIIIRSDTW